MVKVCDSNIFLSRRPTSVHLSVTLSPKPLGGMQPNLIVALLDFSLTFFCYITSTCGKGVREQHYFFRAPVVRPSSPKALGGIQLNLLYHFPSWLGCARATLFFRSFVWRLSILRHAISSLTTWWNLTKLATWPPLMVRVWERKFIGPSYY